MFAKTISVFMHAYIPRQLKLVWRMKFEELMFMRCNQFLLILRLKK